MFELIGIVVAVGGAYFYGKLKGYHQAKEETRGKWEGWPRD